MLLSPQDLLEVVCTMKPVHGSLNPCPDKLHGIGSPSVCKPLGLSFLICERGGHTTSHKGTSMKDLPSGHAWPPQVCPSFLSSPAAPHLPLLTHLHPLVPPSLPWPSPRPFALPPSEQHPSTDALLHLIMGAHQKLQWEGVPTLLLAPL